MNWATIGKKAQTYSMLAIILAALGANPGKAEGKEVDAALADYNAKQYGPALHKFRDLEKKYPNNSLMHYYVALCSQSMGQMSDAKAEFQWVIEHDHKSKLYPMAVTGLQQLGGGGGIGGGGGGGAHAQHSYVAKNNKPQVRTIYYFWSDAAPGVWQACSEFNKIYNTIKWKYRDIYMADFNCASGPSPTTQMYSVTGYPHLTFLDADKKILYNSDGCPGSESAFDELIRQFH